MREPKCAVLGSAIICLTMAAPLPAAAKEALVWEGVERAPASRAGVLPNGFRYVIVPEVRMPGIVRISLDIAVGHNGEDEDQIEVAHLLEHVLSGFYSDDQGRRRSTQDLVSSWGGFEYGESLNASTDDNNTRYLFRVPANRWKEALNLVREQAQGAKFTANEVDAHRPLVIDERRWRGSDWGEIPEMSRALSTAPRARTILIADRERSMKRTPFAAVERFYRRWYRPELQTLYVVGDVDPQIVESYIRGRFSSMFSAPGSDFPEKVGVQDFQFLALPSEHTDVIVIRTFLGTAQNGGFSNGRKLALHTVIAQILTERAAKDARSFGYPLAELQFSAAGDRAYKANPYGIEMRYKTWPKEMPAAIIRTSSIIGRLLKDGIDPEELKRIKKPLIRYRAGSNSFSEIDLVDSYRRGTEAGQPGQAEGAIAPEAEDLRQVTPADVLSELKALIADNQVSWAIYGPADAAKVFSDENVIRSLMRKALQNVPEPVVGQLKPDFAKAGSPIAPVITVASQEGAGAKRLEWPNGLSLFLLPVAEQTSVSALVVNRTGLASADARSIALAPLVADIVKLNGAGGLNKFELEDYLEKNGGGGLNISLGLSASQISVETAAGQEEMLVALLSDLIRQPRIGRRTIEEFARLSAHPGSKGEVPFNELVYSAFRSGLAPSELKQVLGTPTRREVNSIWASQFGQLDEITIVISGRFSEDKIVASASRYLSQLASSTHSPTSHRHLAPGVYRIGSEDGASAEVKLLFAAQLSDIAGKDSAASGLSPIWSDRIRTRIRDVENGSYQPTGAARVENGQLILEANFATRADDVDRLVRAANEEFDNLLRTGLTASEVKQFLQFHPRRPERSPNWLVAEVAASPGSSRFELEYQPLLTKSDFAQLAEALSSASRYVFVQTK